jgi:hypothetical protein
MMALMLKLRHEADASPEHFQVYTGQVRIWTIYRTHSTARCWHARARSKIS